MSGGRILIDGQDIRDVTQESLRATMAIVPQDISLFHRTVLENIRYARPDAPEMDVLAAAEMAHCREFIEALPDGFATMVGDRGVKLSGGQRQRLAIARALLKDAPILLLDEATSALDSESERAIQDALDRLMQGRTVIAIAHRLSTLKQLRPHHRHGSRPDHRGRPARRAGGAAVAPIATCCASSSCWNRCRKRRDCPAWSSSPTGWRRSRKANPPPAVWPPVCSMR